MTETPCKKCVAQGYPTRRIVVQREQGRPGYELKKCECEKEKAKDQNERP